MSGADSGERASRANPPRASGRGRLLGALLLVAGFVGGRCGTEQGLGPEEGIPTAGNSPWQKVDMEPERMNNLGIQCVVFSSGMKEVGEPSVIRDGRSGFLLFYAVSEEGTIAMASSADGREWSRGSVVLRPTEGWEGGRAGAPSVVPLGSGRLALWYEGEGGIGLAHSTDGGRSWEKDAAGGAAVLTPTEPWEEGRVGSPAVVFDPDAEPGERYRMWYEGGEGCGIGYAVSPDGAAWTKPGAAGPVVARGAPGEWDEAFAGTPAVEVDENAGHRRFLMWYTGMSLNNFSIGLAGSFDGPTWTKYRDNPVLNEFPPMTLTIPVDERAPATLAAGAGRWMWFSQKQAFPPDQGFCLATQEAASP